VRTGENKEETDRTRWRFSRYNRV